MAVVLSRLAARPAAEGRMVHTRETAARVALRSLVVVVAFWWMATGVIFALERSPLTRLLGLLVATALAAWGARTVVCERDAATPRGVRHSFLGAAFLWSWVQVAFYGGWLVGPAARMVPVPAEGPSWSLAVRAVLAMLWYQLAMLAVLGGVGAATAGRRNRAGWWALLVFWGTHQLASINIFLGVENPGRGFFPAPLAFLESYFGAARSTWFLPLSVAAILAFTLRCVVHGLRDATPDRRQGMLLLAVLGTLGVLELSVLAMPASLPLWEAFLTVRGY
jgi:putative photosynthetic complex assembly protein 2